MKKRLFLSLIVIITSVQLNAQEPTALWGKAVQGTLGSSVTSQGADIQMAPDGGIYISGGAGTKTVEDVIRFGNDVIANPETVYKGNASSGTQNLFISKIAADGTPVWTVCSKNGNIQSGSAYMQPVADGLLVAFGIQHPTNMLTSSVAIKDALNQVTDLQWALQDNSVKNYYRLIVMKLNLEGAVQWLRQVEVNHETKSDGFTLYGMKTDDEGNIFVGGQLKADMEWPKSDGTTFTMGSSANGADFLLVKLDKNGYYQDNLQINGTLSSGNVRVLKYKNGHLFLMGSLRGTAGASLALGSQSLNLPNGYETLLMASVNSDLTVNWAQVYESQDMNFVMQQNKLYANDNHIYLLGMASLSLKTKLGKNLTIGENMNRVGTLLKFDISQGDLLDGYLKPLFQTGYYDILEDIEGRLYVFGSEGIFTSNNNPNKRDKASGLFVEKFNADNLTTPIDSWNNLIQNVGGCQGVTYTADGHLYTMTRSNVIPNSLHGTDSPIIQDIEAFCCNLCAFQLPFTPVAGIRAINYERPTDGAYYNLSGQRVERPTKGLYIHNGNKVVIK